MNRPAPDPLDQWIVSLRGPREAVDPARPYGFQVEPERNHRGEIVPVATVFLVNRECPWRCLMCDLWRYTLTESVPEGAIASQIRLALAEIKPAREIKLYNAGSFFDPRAIPPADHAAIADLVTRFERVVVENHPALAGDRVLRFRDLLEARGAGTRLEVAMGLETAHPEVLARLNKRITPESFARAAAFLRDNGIDLRVFVLAGLPFLTALESLEWTKRSIDFAFDHGAGVVSIIPTRSGNGALDALSARSEFAEPAVADLEAAAAYGVRLGRGRVFADLWDLPRFSKCPVCQPVRREWFETLNLQQRVPPEVHCPVCQT